MNKKIKEINKYNPKLISHYKDIVMPQLKKNFELKNNFEVPKISQPSAAKIGH